MQFPIRLLAIFMAATAVHAAVLRAPADQPPCDAIPQDFWDCVSDCLYKICSGTGGDPNCVNPCDAACKQKYTPNCEPGVH